MDTIFICRIIPAEKWKKHGMINEYAERFSAEKVNLNTDCANNIQKVTPSPRSRCNKAQFISLQIDKHSDFIIKSVRNLILSNQRKIKRNENFIVLSGERMRWYLRSYFFCLSSLSAFDITFVKDICIFTTAGSSWLYVKVNQNKEILRLYNIIKSFLNKFSSKLELKKRKMKLKLEK